MTTNKVKLKNLTYTKIMFFLKKNNDFLKKCKVKRIGLFGSYALGKQKKTSDIDFLVEFKESSFDNFMDLVFFLETEFDKRVDLIIKNSLSPYIRPYVEKEVRWHEA